MLLCLLSPIVLLSRVVLAKMALDTAPHFQDVTLRREAKLLAFRPAESCL